MGSWPATKSRRMSAPPLALAFGTSAKLAAAEALAKRRIVRLEAVIDSVPYGMASG